MTIREKYKQKKASALNDPAVAESIRQMAAAAITGRSSSAAWGTFMAMFADTEQQLSRLVGSDGTLSDPKIDYARACLIVDAFTGFRGWVDDSYLSVLDEECPPIEDQREMFSRPIG